MAKAKKPIPEGHHHRHATPHLFMDDAAKAIRTGTRRRWEPRGRRVRWAPMARLHARGNRIGDSLIMLNDAMGGGKGPKTLGGSPASFWVYVEDCDALYKGAVAAGAQIPPGPMGQLEDQFWGDRSGTLTDPQGYQWTIATHKEDLTPEEMKQRMDAFMRKFAGAPSQH